MIDDRDDDEPAADDGGYALFGFLLLGLVFGLAGGLLLGGKLGQSIICQSIAGPSAQIIDGHCHKKTKSGFERVAGK